MARVDRYRYVPSFAETTSFDERLYAALRRSPWWMISIAVHVIVFGIAGLLQGDAVTTAAAEQIVIRPTTLDDDWREEKPEELTSRPVDADMPPEPEPMPDPPEYAPEPIEDQDLPFDDSLGEEGLANEGSFQGPGENGYIGLGGDAGNPFGRRRGGNRDAGPGGGDPRTEIAVEDALNWLAAHQSPNGGWEAATFHRWCDGKPAAEGPTGAGVSLYDAGVSGLATLAFLGAGYTHRGNHPFVITVRRALSYLRSVQDAEGCFGPRSGQHYIYNHACAALAMVEAYGMTGSTLLRRPAQKALDFIAIARNPYFAWRYGVKPGDNDTSVTGWMMMALKSAKLVNADALRRGKAPPLRVDEEAFDGIRTWVDKMTDPDYGRTGYLQRGGAPARPAELLDRFPADKSESMTAVGVLARIFAGEDPRRSRPVQQGAALCGRLPPTWNEADGSIDMYYWYYGTLALYQVGGEIWRTWNEAMKTAIVDHQRRDTDYCLYKGSWDPIGPWGGSGGRVYATALMAMCLQVYYRYDRVFVGG